MPIESDGGPGTDVLFIGGRSGSGKSTIGWACHQLLAEKMIMNALIEGDTLDQAWPQPWPAHPLAERNLAAMWRNFVDLGHTRMIYTNTAAVFPGAQRTLVEAIATVRSPVRGVSVVLTASDATVRERLGRREVGASVDWHIDRSDRVAREIEAGVPATTARVATDGRTGTSIAAEIIALTGWAS